MPLPLLLTLPALPAATAGTAAAGTAAAGTAAAGSLGLGKLSLSQIMMLVSLIGELFKKSPEEKAKELQRQMERLGFRAPYQSQYPQQLDPIIVQALLSQLKRTSNWGWPAGMGTDTGFIEGALKNITRPRQSYWGR
jgi:hypothetical protein